MIAVLASLLVPLRSTAKACQNIVPYLYKDISFFGSYVFTTQKSVQYKMNIFIDFSVKMWYIYYYIGQSTINNRKHSLHLTERRDYG